jgi:hypothetical protein
MKTTPEGLVKRDVKAALKRHGVYYFMPVSNGMGAMGVFDFVCAVNGVFVGIECKSDATKKPTPLQVRNAESAKNSGAVVLLIHKDNITVLDDILTRIKEQSYGFGGNSVWALGG